MWGVTELKRSDEDYVFTGFGFPVVLRGAPMVEFRGELVPDIDFVWLQSAVLDAMALKPGRLTGAEIKFIRTELGMTQSHFGTQFGVSHARVSQWEKSGHVATAMSPACEEVIRLHIARNSKHPKLKRFVQTYDRIVALKNDFAKSTGARKRLAASSKPLALWSSRKDRPQHVSFASI